MLIPCVVMSMFAMKTSRKQSNHFEKQFTMMIGTITLGMALVSCLPFSISSNLLIYVPIGTIYYRQERFELAEYHFKRAIEINPNSSVLRCHLGLVLNAHNRWGSDLLCVSSILIGLGTVDQKRLWSPSICWGRHALKTSKILRSQPLIYSMLTTRSSTSNMHMSSSPMAPTNASLKPSQPFRFVPPFLLSHYLVPRLSRNMLPRSLQSMPCLDKSIIGWVRTKMP